MNDQKIDNNNIDETGINQTLIVAKIRMIITNQIPRSDLKVLKIYQKSIISQLKQKKNISDKNASLIEHLIDCTYLLIHNESIESQKYAIDTISSFLKDNNAMIFLSTLKKNRLIIKIAEIMNKLGISQKEETEHLKIIGNTESLQYYEIYTPEKLYHLCKSKYLLKEDFSEEEKRIIAANCYENIERIKIMIQDYYHCYFCLHQIGRQYMKDSFEIEKPDDLENNYYILKIQQLIGKQSYQQQQNLYISYLNIRF
jgi:hypothetical protein